MALKDLSVTRLCGAVAGTLTCDREDGHTGQHRGYNEQIDEPMFWGSVEAPPPARALAPDALLRLGAWTLEEEQSEAVERLLTDQEQTYRQILKDEGPEPLIQALLARDRHLAQTGRQLADGRTAGRLLREVMRAQLLQSDHQRLRQIGDATKTGQVEAILEAMGAEPADARQLKLHGSTLGPLKTPEEQAADLKKAGVVYDSAGYPKKEQP